MPAPAIPPSPTSGLVKQASDYYYVIPMWGQSNAVGNGEGQPLPTTLDTPHPRIKQLAYRALTKPTAAGGVACAYNSVIELDHCPHNVDDMSVLNHPRVTISSAYPAYGVVSSALHIAKKLLPMIPQNAGILIVPCARSSASFTSGTDQLYDAATGAPAASTLWGVTGGLAGNGGVPALYQHLRDRTRAALSANPKNILLALIGMQGEGDMLGTPANHRARFEAMVTQFGADLNATHAAQCLGLNATNVPWICGDTTYQWKNLYASGYAQIYEGSYGGSTYPQVKFVRYAQDENGNNTSTNNPSEDPDIAAAGYFGSASRTSGNWVAMNRPIHFSSFALRGIVAERLSSAVVQYCGRWGIFGADRVVPSDTVVTGASVAGSALTLTSRRVLDGSIVSQTLTLPSGAGTTNVNQWDFMAYDAQKGDTGTLDGWTLNLPAGGTIVNAIGPVAGVRELQITRTTTAITSFDKDFTQASALFANGGELEFVFRPNIATAGNTNQHYFWLGMQHSGANPSALGAGTNATFVKIYVTGSATANSIDINSVVGSTRTILATIPIDVNKYVGVKARYTAGSPTVRFQIATDIAAGYGADLASTYTIVGTGTGDTFVVGKLHVNTVTGTVANTRAFAIRNIDLRINPATIAWTDSDTAVNLSSVGAPHTITLPTSLEMAEGRMITIRNASGQAATVNPPAGPHRIDGAASLSIPAGTFRTFVRRMYHWSSVA